MSDPGTWILRHWAQVYRHPLRERWVQQVRCRMYPGWGLGLGLAFRMLARPAVAPRSLLSRGTLKVRFQPAAHWPPLQACWGQVCCRRR